MNTPLSMLITGMLIAAGDVRSIVTDKHIWKLASVRMLLIPAATLALFGVLGFHGTAAQVVTLLECCPAAAITSVFAVQFGHDEHFAAGSVVLTTLLSIVTPAALCAHYYYGDVRRCAAVPYLYCKKSRRASCCTAALCFGKRRTFSTIATQNKKSHRFCISASTMASYWSGRRGSNSLPPPWQGGALPDELRPHIRCIYPCTLPLLFQAGSPQKFAKQSFVGKKEKIWYSSQKSCLQDFPMNDRIFDVVPPIGIEPMTRGFSVPCSTD